MVFACHNSTSQIVGVAEELAENIRRFNVDEMKKEVREHL